MGKKKTTTAQTNTYGFVNQPKNANYEAAQTYLDNIDYSTPVKQSFGRLRNEIDESGNEFFGGNISDDLRTRIKQSQKFKATTDEGEALSQAGAMENQAKMTGNMALGEATKPYFVNTGGNSTQTFSDPMGTVNSVLGIAKSGAQFAAM